MAGKEARVSFPHCGQPSTPWRLTRIDSLHLFQVMPVVSLLRSWLLAALLAQAFRPPHEAVRGGWQAAVVAIFAKPSLQGVQLLLQILDRFLLLADRLRRLFESLAQRSQFLAQCRILLTVLFQFFVLGHTPTLANLSAFGNLHGPSE